MARVSTRPGFAEEIFQEGKLLTGQFDPLFPPCHLAPGRVRTRSAYQGEAPRTGPSSGEGPEPWPGAPGRRRFGEVVVRPRIQPQDFILDGGPHREEEDWGTIFSSRSFFKTRRPSILGREMSRRMRFMDAVHGQGQPLFSVQGQVHGVALLFQPFLTNWGDFPLVFNDQDPHGLVSQVHWRISVFAEVSRLTLAPTGRVIFLFAVADVGV